MITLKHPNCLTCKWWNNKQAQLDYNLHYGICTSSKHKFTTTNVGDAMLLDRANLSGKHMNVSRFENQSDIIPFGATEKSRYCLVTEEKFGCINHEK